MTLDQPRLFLQKVGAIILGTAILVPLVHFKLLLPAVLYLGALLLLHVYFFTIYLMRVKWHQLRANHTGFATRLLGILLFSYLLTLLHYQGAATILAVNIGLAILLHTLILLFLMMRRDTETLSS